MIRIGDLNLDEKEVCVCKHFTPRTRLAKMYIPKLMTEIEEGKEKKIKESVDASFLKNMQVGSTIVETTNVLDVYPFNTEFIDIYEEEKYFVRFKNNDIKHPVYKPEDVFNEEIREYSRKFMFIRNGPDTYRLELNSRHKYMELYTTPEITIKMNEEDKNIILTCKDSIIEINKDEKILIKHKDNTIEINEDEILVEGEYHLTNDAVINTFNECSIPAVIRAVVGPHCRVDCRVCPPQIKSKCGFWGGPPKTQKNGGE